MEVPTRTFRADWAKPATPLGVWMQSGGRSQYSIKTKLKLYQHRVLLLTFLYGSECWWMTKQDLARLSFHTTSLRKIQRLFWPRTISNCVFWAWCKQENMETIIIRKWWRWTGHVLHKDANSITKVAIHLTPEGRHVWHSWGTIQRLDSDRHGWRSFIAALYTIWHDG